MDLSGQWAFRLDPEDKGSAERWFSQPLAQHIQLPGSLQAQGYGEAISVTTHWTGDVFDPSWFTELKYEKYRQPGNVKVPFWLQPDKHYVGAAWYQREADIPTEWAGRHIILALERPHWETRLWLNDREIGSTLSLSTPHVYDLGRDVLPGKHTLTLRVDNRMIVNVGPNAHSMSDHTQTSWNGIVGQIELTTRDPVWIHDVQIYPDVTRKVATIRVSIGSALASAGRGRLTLQAALYNAPDRHEPSPVTTDFDLNAEGAAVEIEYPLGDEARLWDEFSPALYRLEASLEASVGGKTYADGSAVTFGLRAINVLGTQLAINGRKIFIRGTLECCIFPLTGFPPTDIESWKRIISVCQAHGLNHIRFHSWCPPEAAFIAADELGFYYQVECAAWANQGAVIGEGNPLDEWLYEEGARITTEYGNHPSFIMMAYGNEPAGRHEEYLGRWVAYWKQKDTRRVHTSGAGWPAIPENHYHNIPRPRIQAWGSGLKSRINALPPETRTDYGDHVNNASIPIISHETGQWCVYPNFDEIRKYTGSLKARNFEIFRDFLEANHMGDQAEDFLLASGKLQALCYKEEIESALRTAGFGGFQLLDLHDFPGQGTALVGVLDPFWDSKGYVTPAEFSRFCNSTVPLARMSRRYWRTSETFSADIDVAHFGPHPLNTIPTWKLMDVEGMTAANGQLAPATLPTGGVTRLGAVSIDLSGLKPARKYTLVVGLEGTSFENDWDIWAFPDKLDTGERLVRSAPDDVLIFEALDEPALARLNAGGRVLLLIPPEKVKASSTIGFSSVFWNTAWTRGQAPHTLGILCDPKHPVFAHFPTEYHSNWQWWELIHDSAAMTLDHLPPGLRPLIQPIDTWFEARRLGLLFEAKVQGGRLVVCSMELRSNLDERLVARQMRYGLLRYMHSADFNPTIELDAPPIQALTHSG